MHVRAKVASAAIAAVAIGGTIAISAPSASADHGQIKHVLLISVDGMHQSDLEWWIEQHPNTVLAKLTHGGAEYFNNHTSEPSDSDPGGTALMTGGDPRATGAYYDVAYNHEVFPPGDPRPARVRPRAAMRSTTRRTTSSTPLPT